MSVELVGRPLRSRTSGGTQGTPIRGEEFSPRC
jgi:hypothetical protein